MLLLLLFAYQGIEYQRNIEQYENWHLESLFNFKAEVRFWVWVRECAQMH